MTAANNGLVVRAPAHPLTAQLLTPAALAFVEGIARRFEPERQALLQRRVARQARLDGGELPDFLPETAAVREAEWQVATIPADLRDRRVEITGPVDRKMVINALNSGARVFMADFEDSSAPTWANLLEGQQNLIDAVRRTIHFDSPGGKSYRLNPCIATLMVRPRGWHLPEHHVLLDGVPIGGALFDFALFLFHNAAELLARGTGAYYYLPKLESHLEARLWNQVIDHAENALGLARGTVRCTVLIETILAAFEMDEILFELKEHIVGLNCGRWDYIFSYIRAFQNHADRVLPQRAEVTMAEGFLRAYSLKLIQTCHRRGAFAMGGMAAQIPIKGDAEANAAALAKVRADKEREAGNGHDGTWVAHPALVPMATEIFDRVLGDRANQLDVLRTELQVSSSELLAPQHGRITEAGVRSNVSVALRYLMAWLGGQGCVPIHHLMEDAATAEISRSQLWQWRRHNAQLEDGRRVDAALIEAILEEELKALLAPLATDSQAAIDLREAAGIFRELVLSPGFASFLTLPCYTALLRREPVSGA